MSNRSFDAVFVDFYGTICGGDGAAVHHACDRIVRALGLDTPAGEFAVRWGERFFEVIEQSNHDDFRTLYECEQVSLRDILRPLVGEVDPVPYVAPLEEYWRAAPLHEDAVGFLKGLSVPVCCVSNADNEPLSTAIQRHGLRFDAVVTSEDARCYKPERKIFQKAADVLGVTPLRTLHVGDSLHSDVNGAAKLGITTAWLRRDDRIHDVGNGNPDFIISSLTEIVDILT